jgi:glycosyltransferase involved in cell wall biosynthesis
MHPRTKAVIQVEAPLPPEFVRTLAALRGEAPFDVVHCHYGVTGLRYGVAARRVTSLSPHMDDRLRALGCPTEKLRRVPLPVDAAPPGPPIGTSAISRLAALARNDREGALAWNDDEGALAQSDDPRREIRLLTVARLVEKKGIDVALRALASVRDEFPNLRYDVIGDGPLRGELEALAASLGIAERVRFAGALPNDRVQQAMRDADLFVLPSVTAPNGDEEGTPTVLLEAACARLPVLATRHAGIPEIVAEGRSATLVAEGDPAALADGLRAMIAARARWAAMGEAGRRLVIDRGHLTADVAARLEALYLGIRLEQGSRR